MKVIDCHGHYFPPQLMEAFRSTTFAKSTSFLWESPAYSNLGEHIKVMDDVGVDVEVLVPSAILLESFRAAGISSDEGMKAVNDCYAEAVKAYPGRFVGTIAVDPFAGASALKEIERGATKLGLKAVSMMASYDGLYIDHEQFWPIFRLAQELRLPVMAHPVALTPYWKETQRASTTMLRAEISMLLDSTICIGRFVRYSIYDKFPEVNFLFCQLGGTIPFLFGRFDLMSYFYSHFPRESVEGEAVFPLKSLHDYRGRIFGDSHSMDRVALECAADSLGAECIVVGGDFPISPWPIGIAWSIDEIKKTRLSSCDKSRILGGNAARILNLE
ncbi:MAG: amidohydrolase [Chloroflexi bacterium]|nr:amidohydrolase [Chloroflexota bacterium]